MASTVRQLAAQIDAAFDLFQQALAVGEKLRKAPSDEDIFALVQERENLSVQTGQAMDTIHADMDALRASPSEQAFLQEKLARVQDLAPRFRSQDIELKRGLTKQMDSLRAESARLKRNTHAIRQYISAPGNKPWIK